MRDLASSETGKTSQREGRISTSSGLLPEMREHTRRGPDLLLDSVAVALCSQHCMVAHILGDVLTSDADHT